MGDVLLQPQFGYSSNNSLPNCFASDVYGPLDMGMYLFSAAAAEFAGHHALEVHKANGDRAVCGKHTLKSLRLFRNLASEIKFAALWLARMWSI